MKLRFLLPALGAALPALSGVTSRPLPPIPARYAGALLAPIPAADPRHFMFAVCGDNRPTGRTVPPPPSARQILSEYRILRPVLSLWTGDMIYGADDTPGEAAAEYRDFLALAATGATPIYNAPGNHEINERADLEEVYRRSIGPLYGSFDFGRSHFIAVDTEEVGRPPGIGPDEERWLQADLEANRGADNIFVFMHHPLFPMIPKAGFSDPAIRDRIHRLFRANGVRVVFGGHEHLFYESVHDGIDYVVTGGGGAPNEPGPEKGGFQNYVLVTVNGRAVKMSVIEPWRLFATIGPIQPDGSCSARVDNYTAHALAATVDFPTDALGPRAAAAAWVTYKGRTEPLVARIVPSGLSGVTRVQVRVPKGRSADVSLHPRQPEH